MKKFLIIAAACVLLLAAAYLLGIGLTERTDVGLTDYSVSENGDTITLEYHVASSMGYTRGCRAEGGGLRPYYLTFYSTFGGLNSSCGANNSIVLPLSEDDCEIYFNRSGGFELVLQKNPETGEWERPGSF